MNRTTRLKKPQIPELDTLYQFNDLGGRPKYGGVEMTSETDIPSFQEIMDETHSAVVAEATARDDADDALQAQIDSLDSDLTAETTAREAADQAEATARAAADQAETTARQEADTNLQNQITQEAQARAAADTAINGAITSEATARQTADAGLQSQIDAITASSDVKDIVGTKAELNNYDTSTLGNNDIIKVLQDESENNATTYYRWNATTQQFTLIGEEGPYYTKSQADTLLNAKQNTLTAGSNVQIVNDTISATDTTYTAGTGLALNGTQFSVDTTTIATQSDLTAGLATKQDTLTAGTNIQITNNVISATDTTYSNFTGTDGTAAGTAGLVPAPATTDAGKFLKADGTWDTAGSAINVVQNTGTSTTDVMSQNAVTKTLFQNNDGNRIKIGNNASTSNRGTSVGASAQTSGERAVAIGDAALASGKSSVAVGRGSQATTQGQFDIGDRNGDLGYNNSAYRLLTGLYDGQSAHDAATKGQLDSIAIQNAGAPTTATVGTVGQLLEDTTNGKLYICTDATNPYVWEEVGAGGGGPTVVQTTGTSTKDVMSQNAVTSMVYADPGSNMRVRIGAGADNIGQVGGVSIGNNANNGIGLGKSYVVGIGSSAKAGAEAAVAIGIASSANGVGSIALGARAQATSQGEMNIGATQTSYGYNSSNYRLLTGLYDPQSDHDAATKGYVDGLVGNVALALNAINNGGGN